MLLWSIGSLVSEVYSTRVEQTVPINIEQNVANQHNIFISISIKLKNRMEIFMHKYGYHVNHCQYRFLISSGTTDAMTDYTENLLICG